MPLWTPDSNAFDAAEGAPHHDHDRRLRVDVRAMACASRLFSAEDHVNPLPDLTASAMALEPGQMCLVSLADHASASLRPVALSHARRSVARDLRSVVLPGTHSTPADAFSSAVFRSGSALRMAIGSPSLLRLWLPDVYLPIAERAAVSAVLAAALRDRDRVFGALLLWREGKQPAFDELDQAYVVSLARRLAAGLATYPVVASVA